MADCPPVPYADRSTGGGLPVALGKLDQCHPHAEGAASPRDRNDLRRHHGRGVRAAHRPRPPEPACVPGVHLAQEVISLGSPVSTSPACVIQVSPAAPRTIKGDEWIGDVAAHAGHQPHPVLLAHVETGPGRAQDQ
jgi:hypothetical protein